MNRAWDRQEDETKTAFDAFSLYLAEEGRSLAKVAKRRAKIRGTSGANLGQLERWSSRYGWVERASSYDKYIHDQAQARVERQAVARREELLRREAEMADKLHARFSEMIAWPFAERVIEDEEKDEGGRVVKRVVHLIPAKWNANSMRLVAETASTLGRKAADMTEGKQRVEVTGADGEPLNFADAKEVVAKLSTAELAEMVRKRVHGDDA